jgi:kynureninase
MLDLGPYPDRFGFERAVSLDAADPLSGYRDEFVIDDPELIYLDGNSLGRLPIATIAHLENVIRNEWGRDLIASWGNRWWQLATDTGNQIAPVIGALPDTVVVADSTSVCLYKAALGALRMHPDRTEIVTDALNFPTDAYVLSAAGAVAGNRTLSIVAGSAEDSADEGAIIEALSEDTALLVLSHVAFKSGYLYDMERLTRAAHNVGALVLWDLSHSVGVIPMDLSAIDLAVGCTYKYLNGGPGSPAFIYVNPELQIANPLTGWWGHAEPFAFDLDYAPASSITRFQTGTMPILSLSGITPGVAMIREAGVDTIRAKSVAVTSFLVDLADEVLAPLGFSLASPRQAERRGSHVSLRHESAWQIAQAMIHDARVIPDFRDPDNIRLGLAPLYTTFSHVHSAVHRVASLVAEGRHERYPAQRATVT